MPSQDSLRPQGQTRIASAATLVEHSDRGERAEASSRHRTSYSYQPSIDGQLDGRYESTPLTTIPTSDLDRSELKPLKTTGGGGFPWPFRWLFFNGLVSLLWGIALAVFCAGKVPWHWNISQFAKRFDREWVNEVAALVGTICKLHVTYILQQALDLYSQIIVAQEFTLKDLKWMQGVKEETVFAEFPAGRGAPPHSERPQGVWGRAKGWWWSIVRFFSILRISWIVLWIGLLLHNTAIVSILQPEEFWQHFHFNDHVPCGVEAGSLTLNVERFLSQEQQQVLDKVSFEIGIQLGNYVCQVSGNTTTAVSERNYRKDNFAYGGIGGLAEGLQDIPGVQYIAECTTSLLHGNSTWNSALPGVSPPSISPNYDEFFNAPTLPDTFRTAISHPSLDFNISLFESAMYAVVDPLGNGAFVALSKGAKKDPPSPLICSWKTLPKLIHVEMVNFTALVLGHEATEVYPSLTGRATLATLLGMVQASRLGANIHLALEHLRQDKTWESGPSYRLRRNSTTAQIVEMILADGGKASMTKYNAFLNPLRTQSNGTIALCDSKNKTVASHWRFGNNKKIGWIAVVWTIGMGLLGMWTAVWMSRKERLDGMSPLGAAGGFALAIGENIPDDRPLRVKDSDGSLQLPTTERT